MSKRRKPHEIVYHEPPSELSRKYGWTGILQIQPQGEWFSCNKQCGDPECCEWTRARIMRPDGSFLGDAEDCHITECEMGDIIICRLINATKEPTT